MDAQASNAELEVQGVADAIKSRGDAPDVGSGPTTEQKSAKKEKKSKLAGGKADKDTKTDKSDSESRVVMTAEEEERFKRLNKPIELADFVGFGESGDEKQDQSEVDDAALLKGFESDTSREGEALDIQETPPIVDVDGKVEAKLLEARKKSTGDEQPGTIYVGRIPHGFYEIQMRAFFSQFGDITRLRLSRNRSTGASKHYAFIEFASAEVAKIAAETMNGYLMFGHILKSKFAPDETLHADVWKGANKKFRKLPYTKLEGQKLAAPKTVEQWQSKNIKEESRRKNKAKALQSMGYEMPVKPLADPASLNPSKKRKHLDDAAASRQLRLENGDSSKLEDTDDDVASREPSALELPAVDAEQAKNADSSNKRKSKKKPAATNADVAAKVSQKSGNEPEAQEAQTKKDKKAKKSKKTKTEGAQA